VRVKVDFDGGGDEDNGDDAFALLALIETHQPPVKGKIDLLSKGRKKKGKR